MGKVLSGIFFCVMLLLVTGCTAQVQPVQLAAGIELMVMPESLTIVEVGSPALGIAGAVGFSTAIAEDSQGRYFLIPIYTADRYVPGQVVRGKWVFLSQHMYENARKFAP